LKLEPDDTPTHDTRDHPPPQHISGDSAASLRPSSGHDGRSQPAASFQVLPPTMRACRRAIVLQYRRLLHARVVTIYTFLRGGCVWGSVLEITWTQAVISCRVNCCWRPFFKKNQVLTSLLTSVILRPPQTPLPANSIFYNIDIGDLSTPICRYSSRLRCRLFSMSDVYIGRTLVNSVYIS